jgi:PucR family transcriptional regulator, purine catabolism regulatory protein
VSTDFATGFTLGDLLANERGLTLLSGGEHAASRRVAGAHTIEIDHPVDWLERDWVMLTTGVRLRHSATAQRQLVADLQEAGAAALGFGVGIVFKHVPPALLEEARRRGFPVFEIPAELPFRALVSTVSGSVLSSDMRSLQRLSSLQGYLMEALQEAAPRGPVVERLASFADAAVTLFGPRGEVEASAGAAPAAAIWAGIARRPAPVVSLDDGAWETVALPVGRDQAATAWLAVSVAAPRTLSPFARAAARAAVPVLAALTRLDELASRQQTAIEHALLDELLACADAADGAALRARAAALGIDLAQAGSIVLAAPRALAAGGPCGCAGAAPGALAASAAPAAPGLRAGPSSSAGAVDASPGAAETFARMLAERVPRALVRRRGEAAVALVPGGQEEVAATVAQVLAGCPGWVAGIGRPVADATAVRHSLHDAEVALRRVAGAAGRAVLRFDDLDLATLVATETSSERYAPKVEEVFGALSANPSLYEAVVAYFEHDLDVMRTARAMHLHHNSLRYRLGRVERTLGRSLKEPATIASVYIALAARAVAV